MDFELSHNLIIDRSDIFEFIQSHVNITTAKNDQKHTNKEKLGMLIDLKLVSQKKVKEVEEILYWNQTTDYLMELLINETKKGNK